MTWVLKQFSAEWPVKVRYRCGRPGIYRAGAFLDPNATSAAPLTSANPIKSGDIGMIFRASMPAFTGLIWITFSRLV